MQQLSKCVLHAIHTQSPPSPTLTRTPTLPHSHSLSHTLTLQHSLSHSSLFNHPVGCKIFGKIYINLDCVFDASILKSSRTWGNNLYSSLRQPVQCAVCSVHPLQLRPLPVPGPALPPPVLGGLPLPRGSRLLPPHPPPRRHQGARLPARQVTAGGRGVVTPLSFRCKPLSPLEKELGVQLLILPPRLPPAAGVSADQAAISVAIVQLDKVEQH